MRILLVTDGQYVFAHIEGEGVAGPFSAVLTEDGQVRDVVINRYDPNGLPFNPVDCVGGRVHSVVNPLFPPSDLWADASQGGGDE